MAKLKSNVYLPMFGLLLTALAPATGLAETILASPASHGQSAAPALAGGYHSPYWGPGGYEPRIGSPYYYSPSYTPSYAPAAVPSYAPPTAHTDFGYAGPYGSGAGYAPVTPYGANGYDPYTTHFGPGFHRHSIYGHYRFPYYSYRAPWYFPGHAVYNRDTNFHW